MLLLLLPGSVAGYWAVPFQSHYSASKAAVRALTDSLRVELAPFSVNVVYCAPGFVKTEIFNKATGSVFVDQEGPYAPLKNEIGADVFNKEGRMALPANTFAKRFVSMALMRKPPSVYLDGRWSWSVPFAVTYLPRAALDWWAWLYFKVFELTDWAQAIVPPTSVSAAAGHKATARALDGLQAAAPFGANTSSAG